MGLTVLDAGVIIGFLDRGDAHHQFATASFQAAAERNDQLAIPASVYAEVLVGPFRSGNRSVAAVAAVDELIDRVPVSVEPLSRPIAAAAARVRAKHPKVRLPDALVIATAMVLDADVLVTTDRGWPPRSRLGLRAQLVR